MDTISQSNNSDNQAIKPYGIDNKTVPKTARRLTAKQIGYVRSIASGKTRRQAIRDNYDLKVGVTNNTIDKMAELNDKRPAIMALLNKHQEYAQQTVIDVMTYSNKYGATRDKDGAQYARVALDGANALLDRVHGKAKQSMDVSVKAVNVNVDLSGDG